MRQAPTVPRRLRDLETTYAFVHARYAELAAGADPLVARWAAGMLDTVEQMRSHLDLVPSSGPEVERFLLRIARAHATHPDYRAHWLLAIPEQRQTSSPTQQ
ncbi:MAG: hypothetical protein QM572_03705 [Nocardioides sp.]|uniref:hypothetical protein n=1 Tax=Nocardioides sp. TaxID=35761 RepID=UPI0039E671D3